MDKPYNTEWGIHIRYSKHLFHTKLDFQNFREKSLFLILGYK